MGDREFTDGELELVISALTEAMSALSGGVSRRREFRAGAGTPFEFDDIEFGSTSETLLGFRNNDPRVVEQLAHGQRMLDRLLRERDRRRAVTLQRVCEWAEFGLPVSEGWGAA